MKLILATALLAAFAVANASNAAPMAFPSASLMQVQIEHGGGCRKSSPPGKCCHMETATGRVHCH
ncbi:hypothetical protein SCH4B_0754 [Ruegeria sp. TrichCH4B]|nr:hypothetical protein SCH4B_0754 [Ruegeria sp. TrichCH4B]